MKHNGPCGTLRRRALRSLALLAFWLPQATMLQAADTASREYQIKAAFLYNFTKFVEWPASSFASDNSPIIIGTYCADPFADELAAIVAGRKVYNRPIAVRKLGSGEEARSAHLVFVCADNDARVGSIESAVGRQPVLTVGESDTFDAAGGIIRFVAENDKIRFEINADAAAHAGIRISAQLQKLARAVREQP
ncbi:MAG TPA: YfiR family protein [Nevskiaceae bacterium]|nr:YfiR family protein [Nevskiaceae bacterium]